MRIIMILWLFTHSSLIEWRRYSPAVDGPILRLPFFVEVESRYIQFPSIPQENKQKTIISVGYIKYISRFDGKINGSLWFF